MLNSKSIGSKIVTGRKKMNLTQAELAQAIAISPQAVGKWERGESMPDITTLNRLAEIMGVDLNYFSETFSQEDKRLIFENEKNDLKEQVPIPGKKMDWNWDMSSANWIDSDFSGLKNINEEFSASNIQKCKFISSDLSQLSLRKNNIENCDFSGANIRESKIHASNLLKNQFNQSSFIDAEFYRSNVEKCDFTGANFAGTEFVEVNFEASIVNEVNWTFTKFKKSNLSRIIISGTLENCHFEQCGFYNVTFENARILNTFFKYNQRFKKVKFVNCVVDKLTYAFLKNNQANLDGIIEII